jgi:hypothetical protein
MTFVVKGSINTNSINQSLLIELVYTEKRNRLRHTIFFCAPSDRKRLTVMIRKLDSNGSATYHNRSTTFLMQLSRSLVTFRVIDFVFPCMYVFCCSRQSLDGIRSSSVHLLVHLFALLGEPLFSRLFLWVPDGVYRYFPDCFRFHLSSKLRGTGSDAPGSTVSSSLPRFRRSKARLRIVSVVVASCCLPGLFCTSIL